MAFLNLYYSKSLNLAKFSGFSKFYYSKSLNLVAFLNLITVGPVLNARL